ncbi:helix-turn-helix domain-containing protein [Amnibacterium kyonggiense]|uniref:helix-turn-helix domain-containing protein n=1 Tax=Amnibacterium kyonggiense TaxID=595671 RepID=UPI00106030BD|nr:helix-turn-helix transcriptional regulator [Amnibacterium kyonggiense]
MLIGAPGSGGSRVLTDAFTATRRAGIRTARLVSGGSPCPLAPLLDRETRESLPSNDPTAVRAATASLGLEVVFLDDAHLLDEASAAVLADLARSGTALVANATGASAVPEPLRRLIAEGRADAVPLDPLTRDEVAELAEHLLGDPVDGDVAIALTTASGGRPRALSEVVDAGIAARSLVKADGRWHLAAPLPPARSLRTAVLDAYTALSPEHRGWIAAVAQARSLAEDLARRIATAETVRVVEEAGWTARDPASGAVRLAVEPAGPVVLGSLNRSARTAVLQRLIAAAQAVDRPLLPEERVDLLRWRMEVGLLPDPAEARALAMLPGTDPAARELLLRAALDGGAHAGADLADHLRRTRRPTEALQLIDEALPRTDGGERVSLLRVRALTTGVVERRSGETLAALDRHLLDAEPEAELLAVRASMLLLEARPAEAVEVATTVLDGADRSAFATGFSLLQLALGQRELGRLEASLDAAARLLALDGVEQAFQDGRGLASWLPSELLVAVGAEPEAVRARVGDEHAAAQDGLQQARAPMSYTLATIAVHRAEPGEGVRLLRDVDAASGAWREGWQPRILAELTIAQTLSGAIDDAGATLERLGRIAVPPIQRGHADLAAAQLAAARGDTGRARAIVAETAERGAAAGLALDAFEATFAGIRYGDDEAPRRLLALGALPGGAGRDAQRAYAAALIAADAAAVDAAAVRLWEVGLRLHAIEAAHRAASLGDERADRRLVAWLARTPSLRPPETASRRATGLTVRERQVAMLAAGGASDRVIATELGITLRTAQTHLGRALGKLGVHRRTELRGLLLEP